METRKLLASTGSWQVDDILRGVVGIFELSLPGSMRGYYLPGSYSDSSAVWVGDIDLLPLFKGALVPAEHETVAALAAHCDCISPVQLDLWSVSEAEPGMDAVPLKLGGLPISDEDVRAWRHP